MRPTLYGRPHRPDGHISPPPPGFDILEGGRRLMRIDAGAPGGGGGGGGGALRLAVLHPMR